LINAVKSTKKMKSIGDGRSSNKSDGGNVGNDMASTIIVSSAVQLYNKGNTSNTTGRGGKVDEVIISIKDRGTGIDGDIQDKLFSKFVTRSDSGSGLGLYISKGIVEAHGGRIWGGNNIDGSGASFAFSLPVS
jgi:signal transduction histidine kinase